ncbi:DMP19 family protein [Mameliella alba]|uniref:DMP19 family protein n=1 Tax=Mameliella alba TaxID=561184 RepID=UPI000B52DE25|nr:hypothetical protein [Mameliella alba]MBY6121559.1 hypothetical protein [Mameliella alba]OWV41350.1 hypothetical protein CDZ95_18405 [Mameliella alba]OWV57700.1 hypothetical protein CDZ97_21725 [Mameliella alba]
MSPLLIDRDVALKLNETEPPSYQLYDCFEDFFPPEIEKRIRGLNQSFPLMGLKAQVAAGQISYGQWLLYTTVCLTGQITNGGVEGFFANCPGLILDAAVLLDEWAKPELSTAYKTTAEPFLKVIRSYAESNPTATGNELDKFWDSFEAAFNHFDEDASEKIEDSLYDGGRKDDPENWFFALDVRVLEFVLKNRDHFQRST